MAVSVNYLLDRRTRHGANGTERVKESRLMSIGNGGDTHHMRRGWLESFALGAINRQENMSVKGGIQRRSSVRKVSEL